MRLDTILALSKELDATALQKKSTYPKLLFDVLNEEIEALRESSVGHLIPQFDHDKIFSHTAGQFGAYYHLGYTRSQLTVLITRVQSALSAVPPGNTQSTVSRSDKVFIVHGHDESMKFAVSRVVTKLGLKPIILHDLPNRGRSIIEKFTETAGDIGFAIVLLSPDDKVYSNEPTPDTIRMRARQNVIFELGFFLGTLGRNRVLVLHKKHSDFEMLSDYAGVLFTPYDEAGRWELEIVKELHDAEYSVDANKLVQQN